MIARTAGPVNVSASWKVMARACRTTRAHRSARMALEDSPNVKRCYDELAAQLAVERRMAVPA